MRPLWVLKAMTSARCGHIRYNVFVSDSIDVTTCASDRFPLSTYPDIREVTVDIFSREARATIARAHRPACDLVESNEAPIDLTIAAAPIGDRDLTVPKWMVDDCNGLLQV
ncbi:hypothetical protein [Curtobacterium sp. VKM Ac-2922]|uniref:hypothetical protein n=1 Tax=Curtobacterium sp. VKM Ac-2922 TaxID=2929475 RepID=UPI001FB1BFDD|nr:hypothetical protein [Curtobacterium sp. VKM Ac-2922]MCJ1715127.1 hypothetical protein [Curtobacterium sp. VKM Ac-2922]